VENEQDSAAGALTAGRAAMRKTAGEGTGGTHGGSLRIGRGGFAFGAEAWVEAVIDFANQLEVLIVVHRDEVQRLSRIIVGIVGCLPGAEGENCLAQLTCQFGFEIVEPSERIDMKE
jgi:hypothetical protein